MFVKWADIWTSLDQILIVIGSPKWKICGQLLQIKFVWKQSKIHNLLIAFVNTSVEKHFTDNSLCHCCPYRITGRDISSQSIVFIFTAIRKQMQISNQNMIV